MNFDFLAVSELPRAICWCIELLTLFQQEKCMYTAQCFF